MDKTHLKVCFTKEDTRKPCCHRGSHALIHNIPRCGWEGDQSYTYEVLSCAFRVLLCSICKKVTCRLRYQYVFLDDTPYGESGHGKPIDFFCHLDTWDEVTMWGQHHYFIPSDIIPGYKPIYGVKWNPKDEWPKGIRFQLRRWDNPPRNIIDSVYVMRTRKSSADRLLLKSMGLRLNQTSKRRTRFLP